MESNRQPYIEPFTQINELFTEGFVCASVTPRKTTVHVDDYHGKDIGAQTLEGYSDILTE